MKTGITIGIFAVFALVAVGGALAYWPGMMGSYGANGNSQLPQIMENGSYQDFQAYQQAQPNAMPWIQNEQDFKAMQQTHNAAQEYRKTHVATAGRQHGQRGRGGCPMWGNDGDE